MSDVHAKPNHSYHLVDPSPWPILGAIGAFVMALGAIMWMKAIPVRGAQTRQLYFRRRPHRRSLCYGLLVAGRDQGGADTGRSLADRFARPALRHDSLHRFGSDVLRRLVLGLLRRGIVPRRADRICAYGLHRRSLAAEGHRVDRSLAFPVAQHADPVDLGHDGDLGASRTAATTIARG